MSVERQSDRRQGVAKVPGMFKDGKQWRMAEVKVHREGKSGTNKLGSDCKKAL